MWDEWASLSENCKYTSAFITTVNTIIDGDAFFDKVGIIIAQSATIIKAGDKIEITAGIGTFSMAGNPKITIHGKLIQMENAVASYKFKTPLKAGKYFVPVKIEYTDLKGMINVKMDKLKYTVHLHIFYSI